MGFAHHVAVEIGPERQAGGEPAGVDGGVVVDGDDGLVGRCVVDLLEGLKDVVGVGAVDEQVLGSGVLAFEEDVASGFGWRLAFDGQDHEIYEMAGGEEGFGEVPSAQGLPVEDTDIRREERSCSYEEDGRHGSRVVVARRRERMSEVAIAV